MDHAIYDKRRYPIVDVREGYAEWVSTYEQIVQDEMDLHLLDRLKTIDWSALRLVLDLACGTGRIGTWLKRRCAAIIDGIDITPEMLEVARSKDVYRALHVADVSSTGLPIQAYDVCTQSLADEQGQPDELRVEGVVHYDPDGHCWVATIDWAAIHHASGTPPALPLPSRSSPRSSR